MKLDSQPAVGLVASVLVIGLALWISVSLSPDMVLTWISLILVAMVPIQMRACRSHCVAWLLPR